MNAMNKFGLPGGDKFMDRIFRRAPGVVWDMMSGKVGVQTKEGIATFAGEGDDAQVEINLFDQFGMEVPAFAQSTPISAVNVGDLIYFGSGDRPGWIIEKKYGVKPTGSSTPKAKRPTRAQHAAGVAGVDAATALTDTDQNNVQFVLMKTDGQRTTWKPPKVQLLGMGGDGVMVIRSLLTMLPGGHNDLQGMQSNMMMMMQMQAMSGNEDGPDMEKLMPLMLMGAMGGGNNGGGMNPMMLMMMMGGGGNLFGGNKNSGNGPKGPFNR